MTVLVRTTLLTGSNTNFALPVGITTGYDVYAIAFCDGTGVSFQTSADWRYQTTADGSFGSDGASIRVLRLAYGANSSGVGGTPGYNGTNPVLSLFNTNGSTAGAVIVIAVPGRDLAASLIGLSPKIETASYATGKTVTTNGITLVGGETVVLVNSIDTTSSGDLWDAQPPGAFTELTETQGSFYHCEVAVLEGASAGSGVTYTTTLNRTAGSTNLSGYYTMAFAIPATGGGGPAPASPGLFFAGGA